MSEKAPPTPSQTVGPFFGFALPFEGDSNATASESADTIRIEGQLFDGAGDPVPDGLLEAWSGRQLARCRTDPEGAFHFVLQRPEAAHLELTVFARGLLRQLVTRIYMPDRVEADDPVLALVPEERRSTLVARGDGELLHFDVHLQGDEETVFFAL